MNVIITGGTGLVGNALAPELLSRGHQVIVLTRSPQKQHGLPPSVDLVGWDAKSPAGWGHLVETADAVINLAGASIGGENTWAIFTQHWSDENKRRIRESRLNAGRALTAAIQQAERKPEVLIQASAVGYYGPHGDEAVDESTPPGDDFMADVCLDWENSTSEVEQLGVRRAILRSGLVMTLAGGILPMMLLPFRLFVGGPLGSGRQYVSWIHVRDQVEAICFLLENESASGIFNMTTPNPVTNAQFGKVAGRTLGRPYFFPVPAFVLKLILGEKATLVLDGQRVLPKHLLDAGYHFHFTELEPALRDLLEKA